MMLGSPAQLDASALLELSERATQLSPGRWSAELLQRAFPQVSADALLALPVGSRDRLVLAIHARLGAGPLRSEPVCEACGETYELTLDPVAFGLAGDAPWAQQGMRALRIEGRDVSVRPVSLADLLAVEAEADPALGADLLAARVMDGDGDSQDVSTEALATALEALDPAADIWLETACPECGASQSVAFDPVYFVARELQQVSARVMRDVVDIARAFHWSEAAILALPAHRRAYYVAEALA